MNLQEIRNRLESGFRPFSIRSSDGREFQVPHQEFIMVTKRSVVVADHEGYTHILDPLHIVSLRELGDLPAK
jgi:hypothetical protein